jgi:hypothetical protein
VALHPFPLTRARFLLASRRKADTDNPFKDVDDAVIDYWCEQASDVVQSALGDRATPPLLQWDTALEGAAVAIAHHEIILFVRGVNKLTGADAAIVTRRDKADAFLSRLRPGSAAPGKSENPRFVDSGSNRPRDSLRIVSQSSSMAALLNPGGRGCC